MPSCIRTQTTQPPIAQRKTTAWPVLPKMSLNEGTVVRAGGLVGWAFREHSPKLAAELNDFYANPLKKLGAANHLRLQHSRRIKALKDAGADAGAQRLNELPVLLDPESMAPTAVTMPRMPRPRSRWPTARDGSRPESGRSAAPGRTPPAAP
jgi:hypothetical protein